MIWDDVADYVKKHPLLVALGCVPVAVIMYHRIRGIELPVTARIDHEKSGDDTQPKSKQPRTMSVERRNTLLREVFDLLKEHKPDDLIIRFGQSSAQGYRGYYLSREGRPPIFFGWSSVLTQALGISPFWIVLEEDTAVRTADSLLGTPYEPMPHPEGGGRMVIPVPAKNFKKPEAVAGGVLALTALVL